MGDFSEVPRPGGVADIDRIVRREVERQRQLEAQAEAERQAWYDRDALGGHRVTVMTHGVDTYDARLEMIAGARRTILLSAFSIFGDTGGMRIVDALCERAQHGVDVRVLLDGFGSASLKPRQEQIRRCGVQLLFDTSSHALSWDGVFVIHEKLLIVDGKEFITGGSGYADFYQTYGREDDKWHDLDVRIAGPAACWFHRRFAQNWRAMAHRAHEAFLSRETGSLMPLREFNYTRPEIPDCEEVVAGTSRVLPRYNNPFLSDARPLLQAHIEATRAAKSEIWLYAPYFVPSRRMVEALVQARARGVKVTVLTNSEISIDENPDLVFVPMFNRIAPLLRAGVELRFWNKRSTMHRKGGMFDGKWMYFGSDNQDNRAQDYSSESIVFTDDPQTLETMKREIADDIQDSHVVSPAYVQRIQGRFGDFGRFVTGFIEDFL